MRLRIVLGVLTILLFASSSVFAHHPTPLPDTINTPNFNYIVHFSDDSPYTPPSTTGDDTDYFSTVQAQVVADALNNSGTATNGNPNGYHNGFTNLGFRAPHFNDTNRHVYVYDCEPHGGCDNATAGEKDITFHAPLALSSTDACLNKRSGHELFHHVQYAYISFGKWDDWGGNPVEGMARMMEDKVYTVQDQGACTVAAFVPEVNGYLGNPNRTLWDLNYPSALYWNYLTEQLGRTRTEPQVGVDFTAALWENMREDNDSPDIIATLRRTIHEFDTNSSPESLFMDFAIANYTKDLDVSALDDAIRYRYVDENDGNGIKYDAVARSLNTTLNNASLIGPTNSSVKRWGARYYRVLLDPNCIGVAGFRATGDHNGYALIASRSGQVQRIIRGVGETFTRAVVIPRGSNRYTELTAVAIGQQDDADFSYSFACDMPKMEIIRPTAAAQAHVGPMDAPERFLIRMKVFGPNTLGEPFVEGLQPDDFEVFVGENKVAANQATVISGAYVQGEYWLVAQAPVKTAIGPYPLFVNLGDAQAVRESAVIYDKFILDQVLVIDRSGSMLSPASMPKLDAAKNAASLFVDSARSDDKIGVVSFGGNNSEPNDDATLDAQLQTASDAHRNTARTQISAISTTPSVMTSIGDGLQKGANEFPIRGSAEGEDWMVLLSDGMQNEGAYWADIRANIQAAGIRVNTIALGPYTDQALLQAIASETGGEYYYVDVPPGSPRATADSITPSATLGDLPNLLADVYTINAEDAQRQERLWEESGQLAAGASRSYNINVEEAGITNARLVFNWAKGSEKIAVKLFRPNGSQVVHGSGGVQIFEDSTHIVFHLGTLSQGTWRVELQSTGAASRYVGILSGRDQGGAQVDLYFGQGHSEVRASSLNGKFLRGLPMPILVSLTDSKGPILGADVMASVEHPDLTIIKLPLFDDGKHNDGNPNDGLYGNLYTRTTVADEGGYVDNPDQQTPIRSSYVVRVDVDGRNNLGTDFQRIKKGAFQVFDTKKLEPDGDNDDMPTRYELLHSCLNPALADADKDGDQDGLSNKEEWQAGTDPCHPDTDRGGESDISELKRNANPFDPRDDALPRPEYVQVVSTKPDHMPDFELRARANRVRYPINPAYAKIQIYRSTNPNGPFSQIVEFDPDVQGGHYFDENLTAGTTYYYQVYGLDTNDNRSAPSPIFSGIPRNDPYSPVGSVRINNNRLYTTSNQVQLNLEADANVAQVLISNNPSFAGATWQAYSATKSWTLAPQNGVGTVYVRYRTSEFNESPDYTDSIKILPTGLLGGIKGRIVLPKPLIPRGVMIKFIRTNITLSSADDPNIAAQIPPVFTNQQGDFEISDLPPGSYDMHISYTGLRSQVICNVVVSSDKTTQINPVTLNQHQIFLPTIRR
jgi:hypothetical protein